MQEIAGVVKYLMKAQPQGDWNTLAKALGIDTGIISVPKNTRTFVNNNGQTIIHNSNYKRYENCTICVEWSDSNMWEGQINPKEVEIRVTNITSYGLCIEANDKYITIIRDELGKGEFRSMLVIPAENIIKIYRLAKQYNG